MKTLKGTNDILPEEARKWQYVESTAAGVFRLYGYQEIRTPIIEESFLFTRSIGEATEIVQKQMYVFKDKGGRDICLRPEETASVVRAYIQHSLNKREKMTKLYYFGPMFRCEKPQAGRKRQFHQMGVEAIGSYSPLLDAENIILSCHLLDIFKVDDYLVKINNLGCPRDKLSYAKALRQVLLKNKDALCKDCNVRLERNPLRVLDCKNERCREFFQGIQHNEEYLCPKCKKHFSSVLEALTTAGIRYKLDPTLVRGLDYYTLTTFEITHPGLGAKDAIGGGGRYDELVSLLGGEETSAVGFAIGMERLMEVIAFPQDLGRLITDIYIVTVGNTSGDSCLEVATLLRGGGFSVQFDFQDRSVKAQMRQANKLGVRWAVIIGEEELKRDNLLIKNMLTAEQKEIPKEDLLTVLRDVNNQRDL